MNTNVRAILVFCEGPHDVAFVKKVFRIQLEFEKLEVPFSELPSPFHHLFKQTVLTHSAKDLSLDMAHKFFLPDIIFQKDDYFVFIYNSGGKSKYDTIRQLISLFMPLHAQAKTFAQGSAIVSNVKYLFLYDADDIGLSVVADQIKSEFEIIDDEPFLSEEWQNSARSHFGLIANDKAIYTWGASPQQGTLEDLIYPMFETDQNGLMDKAYIAINDMFTWDDTVSAQAKRKKATITLIGQRKKPGLPMSMVLGETDLITKATWKSHAMVNDFVDFLKDFAGI